MGERTDRLDPEVILKQIRAAAQDAARRRAAGQLQTQTAIKPTRAGIETAPLFEKILAGGFAGPRQGDVGGLMSWESMSSDACLPVCPQCRYRFRR